MADDIVTRLRELLDEFVLQKVRFLEGHGMPITVAALGD